ncbi:integral membrane protein 2B-like isoform X2 [Crassostrea angulata]|uniref:integral membrane protein 2B-like isoform X2 n=1 Tax=Magallana angulata TaxID=2784310 RepID=UPI0022B2113A|nr:integral membrane protein 2B-like isoform X2 [Crassostrea angulata]
MTIYKVNNQEKNEKKDILEQKLLAAVVADSEVPDTHVEVDVAPPPRRHSRAWLNLFLILVAILVLAAGITGGVLLYKRLSHKIIRGQCGFRADLQYDYQSTMMDNDIRPDAPKDPYFLSNQQLDQQWSKDKTEEPVLNKPHKHHRHHRPQMMHYDLSEDVQVIDDQVERIHMPSFKDFRDTMILHDFQKNYTAIVDYDKRSCYIMKLDRVKVTPPKDWIDLIQKFATGYYMPRADVLRKQYRVTLPALKDISFLGRYIEKECLYFQTYTMEKMVGDHFIAKRDVRGLSNARYSYYEPRINSYIQMQLFKSQ